MERDKEKKMRTENKLDYDQAMIKKICENYNCKICHAKCKSGHHSMTLNYVCTDGWFTCTSR